MSQPPPYVAPRKSKVGLIIGVIVACICLCCVLPTGLVGGFGFFAVGKVKGTIECMASVKLMHQAILDYSKEQSGALPKAATWQDDIKAHYAKLVAAQKAKNGPFSLLDPNGEWGCTLPDGKLTGLAFNSDLSGKQLSDVKDPISTRLLFEIANAKRNAHEPFKPRAARSGPELLMGQNRGWIEITVAGEIEAKGVRFDGDLQELTTGEAPAK